MAEHDEWLLFLESHPELWRISKSTILMKILEQLCKESLSLEALYLHFPSISLPDLEEILETFIADRLVEKQFVAKSIVFHATEKCRKFMVVYSSAKSSFTVK